MKLVLLAAGHGRRFGGLKQLAPVGEHGEALIDFTVRQAQSAGFTGIVLVVREEIRAEMEQHAACSWPSSFPFEIVVQGRQAGTVPAVLAARPVLDGPFAVANADDLYDESAFGIIVRHFKGGNASHVLVGYRLANTILTDQPVKRGLCLLDHNHALVDLVEHHVCRRSDGAFNAAPLFGHGDRSEVLLGDEPVSMNLWGFSPTVLPVLDQAASAHRLACQQNPGNTPVELLLPEVLGDEVRHERARVQVVETASRCIGLTHREDLPLVRATLAEIIVPAHSGEVSLSTLERVADLGAHERALAADLASA